MSRSDWPKAVRDLAPWVEQAPAPGSPWQQQPPAVFPPPGAVAYGRDVYGLWYEADLAGLLQRFRYMPSVLAGDPSVKLGPAAVSEGFWLADTSCTQALWQAVTGKTPSRFKGDDLPVEPVSWHDVQVFCTGLNTEHAKPPLQLPSEIQWEHACRAGSDTAFWWGDDISGGQANFNGNHPSGDGSKGEYRKQTAPVYDYAPNPWGLYQMHGNVWEWCGDVYEANEAKQSPSDSSAGERRVLRGGSWRGSGRHLRAADRGAGAADGRDSGVGFRLSHPVLAMDENTAAKIRHAAKK